MNLQAHTYCQFSKTTIKYFEKMSNFKFSEYQQQIKMIFRVTKGTNYIQEMLATPCFPFRIRKPEVCKIIIISLLVLSIGVKLGLSLWGKNVGGGC
jgi:hypothetical protein